MVILTPQAFPPSLEAAVPIPPCLSRLCKGAAVHTNSQITNFILRKHILELIDLSKKRQVLQSAIHETVLP